MMCNVVVQEDLFDFSQAQCCNVWHRVRWKTYTHVVFQGEEDVVLFVVFLEQVLGRPSTLLRQPIRVGEASSTGGIEFERVREQHREKWFAIGDLR